MKIAEEGHRVRPVAAFPGPGAPVKTGSPGSAEAEALFKEAKRRRRRRRLASLAAALVIAAAAAIGIGAIGTSHKPVPVMAGSGSGGVAAGAAIAPGTSVAWVDFHQHLYLGDVVTGTQHVLARIKAFPGERLAQAGRRIYWVDHSGTYIPALHHQGPVIRDLDLATGRIRVDGPGESVFRPPTGGTCSSP